MVTPKQTPKQTALSIQRFRLKEAYRQCEQNSLLTDMLAEINCWPTDKLVSKKFIDKYRTAAAAVNKLKPPEKVWVPTLKYKL